MKKFTNISPFRLSPLLRLEKDPKLALQLFLNPNPDDRNPNPTPFRYSLLSYDLIISKLGRAKLFSEMEEIIQRLKTDTRVIPEEIIFCNVITYYGRARLPLKALQVFDEIPSFRCQRTIKSVNTLLNSLLMCREFEKMRELIDEIGNYASPDTCTYNILINACCTRFDFERAWYIFEEMRKKMIDPNVVTFGTLINGLCANMELDKAFTLKKRMDSDFKIKPNAHIYVALIKGLCKVGEIGKAIELKEEMLREKVELVPAVYTTLICAFFKVGRKKEIAELFEEMRGNGCKPDTKTYNAVISGFCREKEFDSAFAALGEMEKEGCKPDVISYNVIIDGLCQERRVREANELLEDMPRKKCIPDVVTYRTIFNGFCDILQFEEAASHLDEMIFKGFIPHSPSIIEVVDEMVRDQNLERVWATLNSAGESNATSTYIWRLAISMVCKKKSNACELFGSLISNHALSVGNQCRVHSTSEC